MGKIRMESSGNGEDKKRSSSLAKESKGFMRKLEKKEKFYSRVKDAVVCLNAKKSINKKKRLRSRQKKMKSYDLSALTELLPNLDSIQQSTNVTELKPNCKNRKKLVQREIAQMKMVLNDPFFKMDPLAAIHQHLKKTQPPPACDKQQIKGKNHEEQEGDEKADIRR